MVKSDIKICGEKIKIIAKYRCLKCGLKWKEVLRGPTQCPKCNHLYIKWLNYGELYQTIFKKAGFTA